MDTGLTCAVIHWAMFRLSKASAASKSFLLSDASVSRAASAHGDHWKFDWVWIWRNWHLICQICRIKFKCIRLLASELNKKVFAMYDMQKKNQIVISISDSINHYRQETSFSF